MKNFHSSLLLTLAAAVSVSAADETAARLNKAAAVFAKMTESERGIRPDRIASADCIGVIPGFKRGNVQIVFYGLTKGVFAGFGLDGATLKRDQSSDKALYGKDVTNSEI